MSDTNYVDFSQPAVNAAWLNDVNNVVYRGVANNGAVPVTPGQVLTSLGLTDATTPANGAGAIGFLYATVYAGNTIGAWLRNLVTSAGAAFIGFAQPGASAITRTLQAWMQERAISVASFAGADPTGATASDAAFAAWAVAIAGRKGIVPSGTWKLTTGNIPIASGTTVEFAGSSAIINYTGTGSVFQLLSCKNVTFQSPKIIMTGVGAKGIDIQGGWFVNIFTPSIGGSGAANNQTSISILSSQAGNLGWGSYMIEIHNPDFTPGAGVQWGIKTNQTTSDTVFVTHLSVYGGWSSNTPYPLYYRGVSTFRVTGYTPEQAIDGINMASCHDGFLSLGEIDCTGYGHNFPDATCSNITIVAPSHAGSGGTFINRTFYTPTLYDLSEIRLLGNPSTANYFYSMATSGSYGAPLTESAAGGGAARTLRTFSDGLGGQQIYNAVGISSTGTPAANLRGTTIFSASNIKGVGFTNTEADTNFYIALSGNAAGYCWVSAKSTTGFTITCSAANSNSMDWILIR